MSSIAISEGAHLYIASDVCGFRYAKTTTGSVMADYRLSANIIKRSKGQSSVAAAAYRAAMRLDDVRTGITHNYTRKRGVVHAEILAPEQSPEWVFDRAELWNAVETIERRKDAQLSREIQLSLPYELTDAQRLELVRGYVQEQFVSQGMIADIALHHPDQQSDERNFHAHVMLTMRDISPDGFKNKNRDWNKPEMVIQWREQWAHHQNRELERHGHNERVDHRSYAERGIDQEPQQHMGQSAHQMEMRGEFTRIGAKNREIQVSNAERVKNRAYDALLSAQVSMQKDALNTWANEERQSLKERLRTSQIDLHVEHRKQRDTLREKQKRDNNALRSQINSQVKTVTNRLTNAKGAKKIIRHLLGHTKADRATLQHLHKALQAVKVTEQTQRVELQRKQQRERDQFKQWEQEEKQKLERSIDGKQHHELSFKERLKAEYKRSSTGEKERARETREERENQPIERKPQ